MGYAIYRAYKKDMDVNDENNSCAVRIWSMQSLEERTWICKYFLLMKNMN